MLQCDAGVSVAASRFMTALAQDGAISEDSLSSAELDRIYGPLRGQVTDSIHRQETVLANIQVLLRAHRENPRSHT